MLPAKTLSLFACAVVAAISLGAPAGADAVKRPGAKKASSACGPRAVKISGARWSCTFADEFNGTSLDRSKWSVMTTTTSGFSHAFECYVDDPSTVAVASGALRLTSTKSADPRACGSLFSSPYQSGMVFSKDAFAQAYGRFEARIKFPRGTGFTASWWLWPQDMAYDSQSGEIDIAEHFGSYPEIVSPFVHVKGAGGGELGRGEYCAVKNPTRRFHSYALEWRASGKMTFLYDGVRCMTFQRWTPDAPLRHPQPFDQPFFLNLTLAHGWGVNGVTADTPFPATMAVDYVRAWAAAPARRAR